MKWPLLVCMCLLAGVAPGQEIERVEPPFWWTGFEHRELQLLVHGNNVSLLTPQTDAGGISIRRIVRVSNPNYVFVYLDVGPDATPGTFDIVFREGDFELTHTYELRARNPAYGRGLTGADAIYLVSPDRFANGDPGNDEFDFLDDKLARDDPDGRHGGDIRGILDNLDYIAGMGFTAVSLDSVLENAAAVWSYDGDATSDFYAVDPRYGSNEQYRLLADAMRERGIGLVMDLVFNHVGADHWWLDDMPSGDWLNGDDRAPTSNHRRATVADPHASEYDRARFTEAAVATSKPDLNQRNPLVADYLVQNAIWWIEYLGLRGLQVDFLSYADKHFVTEWVRRILQEYPEFSVIGNEWSEIPALVAYWQRGRHEGSGFTAGLPQLYDVPLRAAVTLALTSDPRYWDGVWISLYELLALDFLYADPADLVIFPDHHDTARLYAQLGEDPDLYRMALIFFATLRGIPQFYYGTEVLASHPESAGRGEIRGDFPGGWDGDAKNAFTGDGLSEDERDALAFLKQLLNWRKQQTAIHTGNFMQFVPIGNVYVYFRYDDDSTVMVILNREDEAVTLETARFSERIGDMMRATDVLDGTSYDIGESIVLEPRSARILQLWP